MALDKGYLHIVQSILESEYNDVIDPKTLGKVLVKAVEQSDLQLVKTTLGLGQCRLGGDAGVAFQRAADIGFHEIVYAIMSSDEFQSMNQSAIGLALINAAANGNLDLVKRIIVTPRFKDIDPKGS
jgi:hypothetical protein